MSVLDRILPLIDESLKHNQIVLRVTVPHGLPQLAISPDSLQQILLNILLNAIYSLKVSPLPRHLSISTKISDAFLEITVQDSGIGIPKETRSKIFDPFFTTKPPGEGTGIGLTISRQMAEMVGGRLELIDSAVGACFEITLPVVRVHS
jgi:signal transduction histidine kinase